MEVVQLISVGLPIPEMLSNEKRENRHWVDLSERNPTDRKLGQRIIREVTEGTSSPELGRMRHDVVISLMGAGNCGALFPERWEASWKSTARFVARYLDKEHSAKFWNKLVPAACRSHFSANAKDWYGLLNAVMDQDAKASLALAATDRFVRADRRHGLYRRRDHAGAYRARQSGRGAAGASGASGPVAAEFREAFRNSLAGGDRKEPRTERVS
jgi:hypothetical protein